MDCQSCLRLPVTGDTDAAAAAPSAQAGSVAFCAGDDPLSAAPLAYACLAIRALAIDWLIIVVKANKNIAIITFSAASEQACV